LGSRAADTFVQTSAARALDADQPEGGSMNDTVVIVEDALHREQAVSCSPECHDLLNKALSVDTTFASNSVEHACEPSTKPVFVNRDSLVPVHEYLMMCTTRDVSVQTLDFDQRKQTASTTHHAESEGCAASLWKSAGGVQSCVQPHRRVARVRSREQLFTRILALPATVKIKAQRPGVLDATQNSVCFLRDTCFVPECITPCMSVTSQAAGEKQSPPPRVTVLGPTGASAIRIHAARVPNGCFVPPMQKGLGAPRTSLVKEPTVATGTHSGVGVTWVMRGVAGVLR